MELSAGLVNRCALRERNEAVELTVTALGTIISFAIFLVLLLALPLNHQALIRYFHFDVVLFDSRQLRHHFQLAVLLFHFNGWHPLRHLASVASPAVAFKQTVHFFGETPHERKRARAEEISRNEPSALPGALQRLVT